MEGTEKKNKTIREDKSTEIFLNGIQQELTWARHTESQRAAFTNIILTITLLLEGFIVQRGFDNLSLSLAITMVVLGILGILVTTKLYERFDMHIQRVSEFEKRLDELNPNAHFLMAMKRAKEIHKADHKTLFRVRLNFLWILLHAIIVVAGVLNIVAIII